VAHIRLGCFVFEPGSAGMTLGLGAPCVVQGSCGCVAGGGVMQGWVAATGLAGLALDFLGPPRPTDAREIAATKGPTSKIVRIRQFDFFILQSLQPWPLRALSL